MQRISTEELLGPFSAIERLNAPSELLVEGRLELLKRGTRVGVIGSRKPSSVETLNAERLTRFLVRYHATVVTGFAPGVASTIHETALATHGDSIAVLSTAHDTIGELGALYARVSHENLVISQFEAGRVGEAKDHASSSATLALLCSATILMHEGEDGEVLEIGVETLRLGRPLFILKPLALQTKIAWPKELLAKGAHVLANPAELLDYVHFRRSQVPPRKPDTQPVQPTSGF